MVEYHVDLRVGRQRGTQEILIYLHNLKDQKLSKDIFNPFKLSALHTCNGLMLAIKAVKYSSQNISTQIQCTFIAYSPARIWHIFDGPGSWV